MAFQLVVLQGRSADQAIRLGSGVTTIGRQSGCQLTVRSSQVSRKHCQVFERDGRLIVKDLGSSNGTVVNGKKVDGLHVLATGDVIHVGPIRFRVEETGKPGGVAPPKPGSTAIVEGPPDAGPMGEDDVFDLMLDEDQSDEATAVAPPPKPAANRPAAAPANDKPAPAPPPAETASVGEDAVAAFLLDIDLDDEDKP